MATLQDIKNGTKFLAAFDVKLGEEPKFDMICSFYKAIDESAFCVSIPIRDGRSLQVSEDQKLLFKYGSDSNAMILAGYVDDVVKEGIRRYWKIRRVTEQRQFFKRIDERVKVALPIQYMQNTWPVNYDGIIEKEEGLSLDISSGGLALYLNRTFTISEVVNITLPNIGTEKDGAGMEGIVAKVCWNREAPKGSPYRNICGLQFAFADGLEKMKVRSYVSYVKKAYRV